MFVLKMKRLGLFTVKSICGCRHYAKEAPYVPWNLEEVTRNILATADFPYQPLRETPTPKKIDESNPANHTVHDLHKFYHIPETDKIRLFSIGGIPRDYKRLIQCFGEKNIIIRQPALEIINYLKMTNPSKPSNRYVIYGRKQSGKTVTLNHVMHYAALNGYLIFHVPWVLDWFAYHKKEACLSEFKEGAVDMPLDAAMLLKNFQIQNAKMLERDDLKTTKEYVWSQRESTPVGSPISTLVAHGINRIKYSCQVTDALLQELKVIANEQKCKVLIAVDGFNACYVEKTMLKVQDRSKVTAQRVTLVQSLLKLIRPDWANGSIVLTVGTRAALPDNRESHLPFYLLKKTGFEHVDPFIPVEVPAFNEIEFHNLLDYYEQKRWIQKPSGREEIEFVTSRLPGEMMAYCRKL